MALADTPFLWGAGGAKLTPEQIAAAKQLLMRRKAQGVDTSPVGHWTAGAARIAEALGDVVQERRLNGQEAENTSYNYDLVNSLLGGSSPAPVASPIAATGSGVAQELAASSPAPTVDISGDKETFVASLLPAAIEESKRTGVDPRIIVGQAALETGWGKSAPGNNYFGIKSHGQEGGNTLATTEVINGQPVKIRDSFRAYQSPADSVRGYGDFILQNPRYEGLRTAQGLDGQLQALQASGYATDPAYGSKVGAIARGIQLPSTPAQAIEAVAPQAGFRGSDYNSPMATYDDKGMRVERPYQDPAVSEPNSVASALAPELPAARTVAAAPPVAAYQPQQVAQTQPQASPNTIAQALRVMADPRANQGTRSVAQALIQQEQQRQQQAQEQQTWMQRQQYEQQLQSQDPLRRLQLEEAQIKLNEMRNPSPQVRQVTGREAESMGLDPSKAYNVERGGKVTAIGDGGVTVNNNMGGDKFGEEFAKLDAKALADTSAAGLTAQRNIGRIDQLDTLLKASPTGWEGAAKQAAGEFGINTEGLSNIQSAQAVINSLVPEQRQPGSGPMSDADLALFKQSLPRVINQPGGNELIVNTMKSIAQYDAEGAAIVQRTRLPADQGGISRAQAFEMLQKRPNPLAGFKIPEQKENPLPAQPGPRKTKTGVQWSLD